MNIWRKIQEENDPSGKSQREKEERRPGTCSEGFHRISQWVSGCHMQVPGSCGEQGHESGVDARRQEGGVCVEGGKHKKLLTMNRSSAILEAEEAGPFHLYNVMTMLALFGNLKNVNKNVSSRSLACRASLVKGAGIP